MKNLFDYATKELSQDAFLRWLFENYNCDKEPVRLLALRFIQAFTDLTDLHADEIVELYTKAQWKKIDVTVWITLASGQKHLIAIEDKTGSAEHNQLIVYNDHLEKEKEKNKYIVHKVYYKTNVVFQDEIARITEAKWDKIYDIFNIVKLIENFDSTKNEILDCYILHIRCIEKALSNAKMPTTSDSDSWIGFFLRISEKYNDKYDISIQKYRNMYSYISFEKKGESRKCPYLEIRSRECTDNKFKAYILAYNTRYKKGHPEYDSFKEKVIRFISGIDKTALTNFTDHCGRRKKDPKQIICTKPIIIADQNEFLELLKQCLDEYDRVISSFWNFS